MPLRRRGRHRRRSHRRRKRTRDWADGLPMDVLLSIFRRLDHADVLMSADRVCRSWRRAAVDEPSLWRRITMRWHERFGAVDRFAMAAAAVRRSAGQCEAFCGDYFVNEGFLAYLGLQAPCLKILRLIHCDLITDGSLTAAIMAHPLLEELELSLCGNISDYFVCYARDEISKLKHLRKNTHFVNCHESVRDVEAQDIATFMQDLRSLQLFGNVLTNEGLEAILDSCSKLECLDMRHCFNIDMDSTLLSKCAGLKTLRLPDDPTDDYQLDIQIPVLIYESADNLSVWSSDGWAYSDNNYSEDSDD
ncbi:hypothetical protein EJB05_39231, partial [Eragrostis curvula]